VVHRREWWDYVRTEAEPDRRKLLTRLYGEWEGWDAVHFGGTLVAPYVLLTPPPSTKAFGDTSNISAWGGTTQIRLRPSVWTGAHNDFREGDEFAEGRYRFLADILLHETVHQWQGEVALAPEDAYHGHGPIFRDKCNEIGRRLGLPPVRTQKKRGKDAALPSCAQWPHCVRPPDYYLGAYVPPGGDTDDDEDEHEPEPSEQEDVVAREIEHLLALVPRQRWTVMIRVLTSGDTDPFEAFVESLCDDLHAGRAEWLDTINDVVARTLYPEDDVEDVEAPQV
jgi:hypothetical protein